MLIHGNTCLRQPSARVNPRSGAPRARGVAAASRRRPPRRPEATRTAWLRATPGLRRGGVDCSASHQPRQRNPRHVSGIRSDYCSSHSSASHLPRQSRPQHVSATRRSGYSSQLRRVPPTAATPTAWLWDAEWLFVPLLLRIPPTAATPTAASETRRSGCTPHPPRPTGHGSHAHSMAPGLAARPNTAASHRQVASAAPRPRARRASTPRRAACARGGACRWRLQARRTRSGGASRRSAAAAGEATR